MKVIKLIILTLILSLISASGKSQEVDIVVVVSKANPVDKMTRSQVIDLFMGKYVAFPNGSKARAFDLNDKSQTKKHFYGLLVNMSVARVNSYWSRIKFTGRARPPEVLEDQQELIKLITDSKDAIGYIPRAHLNDKLKVVFEFHE